MTTLNLNDPVSNWDLTVRKSPNDTVIVTGHGQNGRSVVSTSPVTAGHWYHLAIVTHNGVRSLYLNGVLEGEVSVSDRLKQSKSAPKRSVGFVGSTDGKKSFLRGLIDEISIYDRPLTPAEVKTMAHG